MVAPRQQELVKPDSLRQSKNMPRSSTNNTSWFQQELLKWFAEHGRSLPWRQTRNPYQIWISEVMLQQTQVDRVIDFYHHFLQRFANVQALAKATWPQVLAKWRGLGYSTRAQFTACCKSHLHRA